MSKKIRVVHYLNQFFAQIGGEEKSDTRPATYSAPSGRDAPWSRRWVRTAK
jgi:betaine reductase